MTGRPDRGPRGGAVATLAGAWLLTAATHHYIIAPASVLSAVAADLGVPPSTAIWLVSAVPAAWAGTNFALGGWIDRFGDYRMIALGTVVVVATGAWSVWAGRAGSFPSLLAARLVAGVAVGAIWTASTNLIGGAAADASRATAIGVFVTSAPAGFALGQLSAPVVAARYGWPATFLVVVLGAALGFAVLTVGWRRLDVEPTTATTASLRANGAAVLRHPAVWYGCAMAFGGYSLYLFVNGWMPSYLASEFAVSPAVGGLLTAAFPAVGVLSRAGGGVVSDRLLGQRRVPVLQVAFLTSLPLVVVLAGTRRLAVVVAALVLVGGLIQLTFGVVYSYVREVVEPEVTGTALSFLTTAGIAGAFSAPVVAGALIDWSGSYRPAFAYAAGLTALGLVVSWRAPES